MKYTHKIHREGHSDTAQVRLIKAGQTTRGRGEEKETGSVKQHKKE